MKRTAPTLANYAIENALFADNPLRILDVGARGYDIGPLTNMGGGTEIIGFDFDAEECDRLNQCFGAKGHRYFPVALDSKEGKREFMITKFPPSAGFYANRTEFWNRFTPFHLSNTSVVGKTEVATQDLDTFLVNNRLLTPDFIKLDTEGAELDILTGGEQTLKQCLGVLTEVRFQNTSNQPHFAEMDIFLRKRGFRLFDFRHLGRYPRKSLPDPRCWRNGVEVSWCEDKGQLIWGDALYFTDPFEKPGSIPDEYLKEPIRILKLAVLFEAFGFNDCAIEVIQGTRDALTQLLHPDLAIDILTPKLGGRKLAYADYVKKSKKGLRQRLTMKQLLKKCAGWVLTKEAFDATLSAYRRFRRNTR